ncbi:unnamed protein product, partial [Rotaria sp. Silwood2]
MTTSTKGDVPIAGLSYSCLQIHYYFDSLPFSKICKNFITDIFIGDSGSTRSLLISIGKNVLKAELHICSATKFDGVLLWDTPAKLCTNVETPALEAGTSPFAIFKHESTKEAFNKSDVAVFVIDGAMDNSSVTH